MYPPAPNATDSPINDQDIHTTKIRLLFSHASKVIPRRHRRLFTICFILASVSLFAFIFHSRPYTSSHRLATDSLSYLNQTDYLLHPSEQGSEVRPPETELPPTEIDPLDPRLYLHGLPNLRFRENLLPQYKYISSWTSGGWTNDVMAYINLIYLGLITERIPIIPLFNPSHVKDAPSLAFGQVFDLPYLRKALHSPILEWPDVKLQEPEGGELEFIGCWNVWESVQDEEHFPRVSIVPRQLQLDISYTKAPAWIKMIPNFKHDRHTSFWTLASLGFPETRKASLVPPLESPLGRLLLPPDEHLLCFDFLFYVAADQPYEYQLDYSPAWRFVGQHMKWTVPLEQIADQALRKTLGVQYGDPLPNWITIHARRGDFEGWCQAVSELECYAQLPAIVRRVQEVKDELWERRGIKVDNVIMTSDEKNTTWWQEVDLQGWKRIDYSASDKLYGGWDPVFIDVVIQSHGIGFVGTDLSTMSMLARRRVESWHNGVTRTVRWGKPNSDDH